MNFYELIYSTFKNGSLRKLVIITLAWFALGNMAMAQQLTEEVYTVNAVDISANRIELVNPRMSKSAFDMSLAFDVEIWLLSGEKGSLNNLRKGDVVTAVIDANNNQVVKIAIAARANN